ncbi:MAG: DnaJ domain-containing protein [Nodosilinea sp.]
MDNFAIYYDLFSLQPGASKQDLKQAYKRLAKQWHPDRFINDPDNLTIAEEKIKAINVAYEILNNHQGELTNLNSSVSTKTTIITRKSTPQEYLEKAKYLAKEGRHREAAEELTRAVKLNPKYADAYYFRGLLFSFLGFELRGRSDMVRALEVGFRVTDFDPEVAENFDKKPSTPHTVYKAAAKTKPQPKKYSSIEIPKFTAQIQADATFAETAEPLVAAAISPNRKILAIGKANGDIDLWNYKSKRKFYSLKEHKNKITHLEFSNDNQFLFSSSIDGKINLWSLSNGSLVKSLSICSQGVTTFAICYLQNLLVSADLDGNIQAHNFKEGRKTQQIVHHKTAISTILLSSSGDRAVFGANDGAVCLCHVAKKGAIIQMKGHRDSVRAMAFSAAKKHFASGTLAGEVYLWKYPNRKPQRSFQQFNQSINSLSFCQSGQILCALDKSGQLIIWDVDSGAALDKANAHDGEATQLLSLSEDVLLSIGVNGSIKQWRV